MTGRAAVLLFALQFAAFALASFAGGVLVGRFGQKTGPREATVAGAATAAIAWLIGVAGGAVSIAPALIALVLLATVGGATARAGGALGRARR
jgi:hypothetical protein